jgi:hypothetical protein
MKKARWVVYALVLIVLVLHQDFWNFDRARPLVFGVLPIGLAYHAAYSVVCAILMALLVALVWPKELEQYERLSPPADSSPNKTH